MSTILSDIVKVYLPGAGLGLVLGENLFGGLMPNNPDVTSPDLCTALLEYPGEPDEYVMGPGSVPAIGKPRLQILVRCDGDSYLDGREFIEKVVQSLEMICNQDVNGVYYERIERVQEPAFLHRDAARRIFFVCNMAVMKSIPVES